MMYSGILTETKDEKLIEEAIQKVGSMMKFDELKANIDGFETPSQYAKASGDGVFIPDITGIKNGKKNFFEVAVKNSKEKATVSKWKLLSELAQIKDGKFYLMVPKGSFAYVRRIMSEYAIRAHVIKMY